MTQRKNLNNLSKIVLKNIFIILVFIIVGAVTAGGYAKHKRSTTYTARTSVVIGHNLDRIHYRNSTVMSDLNMMDTYKDQIKDPQVMRKAHLLLTEKLRHKYSTKEMASDVHVSNEDHSLVMEIKANTGNAKASVEIANATAHAFKDEFQSMNPSSADVKLLAPARQKDVVSKTSPSIKKYVILGAALGALIGMIVAFGWTSFRKLS